jgi:hypothetical protein
LRGDRAGNPKLKSRGSRAPYASTLSRRLRWLARNQEFRRSYALARQCHAEDFALETLAIAADSSRDYVKTTGVDGKVTWVFDKENFARQRLRIKARKMILARMAPRKYGNP